MAAPPRIVCLNLGTQTVGLGEFQRAENGGVMLNAYRLTEIHSDPSAEAMRLPQTRIAVGEMREALKLKGGPINYAISGQNMFTRFVKLPPVAEDKVESIIGFEAQQNVPFPIEEVVWDYQLVSSAKSDQVEVVLVAIKSDLLDDLNGATEQGGFRTQLVDAAPMAIYNAFRYNYSDLPGCSLVVDLGARTTNLIFIEPGKVFTRSIPIGGNTITGNLAKEFQESFASAEERKKSKGYVSLGGAYADNQDPEVAKEAKIIRNAMTRLHAEISRSINYYRAQQGGSAPQRLFLCGGTANLPYLKEFFTEKFQMPIEFFNPLRNVTVTGNVPVDDVVKHAHQLGELVGLALRSINTCPMELNLRPTSVVNAQRIASRRPYLVVAGLCVLLALAGWWLYFQRAAALQSAELEQLNKRVADMQVFEGKFKKIDADINGVAEVSKPLGETVDSRQYWASVINELNNKLPEKYLWITLMEPTVNGKAVTLGDPNRPLGAAGANQPSFAAKPGPNNAAPKAPMIDGVHLKGLYLENPKRDQVVSDFVANLRGSKLFKLEKVDDKNIILKRDPENPNDWAFEYELQLPVKEPLALQ